MTLALTPRVVAYSLTEEAIGLSAYLDSKDIWTWAGGIADTSGVHVGALYKDKPQPLRSCLIATIDMMRREFLPAIETTFAKQPLNENQLAAALSFTWRNGPNAIRSAQWVAAFLSGDTESAKTLWMQWTDHGNQVARATREQALFFNGLWPTNLRVRVFTATGPDYKPVGGTMADVLPVLTQILGGSNG